MNRTVLDGTRSVGGRFLVSGPGERTTTGTRHIARDTTDGKEVWLKVVDGTVLTQAAIADRAIREWKQIAKVASERVARVIDQGRDTDGQVYVATEVAEGSTLEDLVKKEGALSVDRARSIVLQVGEALTEAQKVGVIHRDVNPRNIVVGAGDKVRVVDFGLAEPVNDKVFGAPAYLSPEQAEGKPVDQRSNIYSLGAVLYYALTGTPPFTGDSAALLQQHLTAEPVPPSKKRSEVPTDLDKVVLKAMEKSSGRRYLTLRQLLTEIEGKSASGSMTAMGSASTVMAMAPTVLPTPSPVATQAVAQAPVPAPVPSSPPIVDAAYAKTPAIEVPAPVLPAAQPVPIAAPAKKAGFRETGWFKQGEIEEELAKAQNITEDPLAPTGITGQRTAVDPSTLSADDRARLSLKTGHTSVMQAVKGDALPGERMDEEAMLAEIDSSKKMLKLAAIGAGVLVLIIVLALVLGGKKSDAPVTPSPSPAVVEPVGAATPKAPTTPTPLPPAPTAADPLALVEAELAKENYAAALDAFDKASVSSSDAKGIKRVEAALTKALSARIARAHKKKDKAGEAAAKADLARLKKLPKKK